jgi:hypothetical protein
VHGVCETVDKLKVAKDAGQVAALSWQVAAKPTPEQVQVVKFVVDDIRKSMTDWKEGGFAGTLPDIYKGIDKALPPDTKAAENKLARKLAELLVAELDNQFKKRPDWQKTGSEVASIVGAFCDGASGVLTKP